MTNLGKTPGKSEDQGCLIIPFSGHRDPGKSVA